MREETMWRIAFAIVAVLVVGFYVVGRVDGAASVRREALRLNHAEYVPDEHGNPTFRWREVGDGTVD